LLFRQSDDVYRLLNAAEEVTGNATSARRIFASNFRRALTGNKILDTLAKDSTQLTGFLAKLKKSGYTIERGKFSDLTTGAFTSDGVFKYDPDKFRVFHLLHENRHFSQIQRAKKAGIDPFEVEPALHAAFEFDAYNFELWLAIRFRLSRDYFDGTKLMRDQNRFPSHDRLLKDTEFLKKLETIFGYNPFK
jgi:hypothetical protein